MEEEEIKRLKLENELLLKKVKELTLRESSSERFWILAARFVAFVIGFLPFIPNALFFIGLKEDKVQIGTSEIFFVAIGFVILWGSSNFGEWANKLGKKLIDKH